MRDAPAWIVRMPGWLLASGCAALLFASSTRALCGDTVTARLFSTGGEAVGTVAFVDTDHGLLIEPNLSRLQPGLHAAHIHEFGDCDPSPEGVPVGNAGDHYDPENTGRHMGPYGDGHLGDLPNFVVESDRRATLPVLAPRVSTSDIRARALIIHAGADRYDSHATHAHGKGGEKMYCGIIR